MVHFTFFGEGGYYCYVSLAKIFSTYFAIQSLVIVIIILDVQPADLGINNTNCYISVRCVLLEELDMLESKITITSILALMTFVAFSTVPTQLGYAQESTNQTGLIVGPATEIFGFADIKSDGHSLNIYGMVNYLPPEGQVFEVWMVDGQSGFVDNIGQVKPDLTFAYDAYLVSPYTYTELFVTIEPENDPDPKPATAQTVGVDPLTWPFGQ